MHEGDGMRSNAHTPWKYRCKTKFEKKWKIADRMCILSGNQTKDFHTFVVLVPSNLVANSSKIKVVFKVPQHQDFQPIDENLRLFPRINV